MTEFITSLNEWAVLLGGLFGLLSTACGVFFAVKNWITVLKTKKSQEIWALIMEIADKAMEEAERSNLSGADKKTMAIDIVKASALAAGIDATLFLDQLSTYIDQTIDFFNKMKTAEQK